MQSAVAALAIDDKSHMRPALPAQAHRAHAGPGMPGHCLGIEDCATLYTLNAMNISRSTWHGTHRFDAYAASHRSWENGSLSHLMTAGAAWW